MKRLLFVISDLEGGGAQRVAVELIRRWAQDGWQVRVATVAPATTDFFALPAGVARAVLDRPNRRRRLRAVLLNNRDRVRELRRLAREEQPDVVVSFMDTTNVLSLAAFGRKGPRVVVSERTDPRHHDLAAPWRWLRLAYYRRADAIVVQTASVGTWAARRWGQGRIRVIPNPVPQFALASTAPAHARGAVVASVGRLMGSKGTDVLLDAFARAIEGRADWRLVLAGDGPLRRDLEEQAQRLGIAEQVTFLGRVVDVGAVLDEASIFAMASRYEGFPNALVEAMAAGLPVISTDCRSGPSEIITDGVDGLLVPVGAVPELASAMLALMGDPAERARMGAAAAESVAERYAPDRIGALWDGLLREMVSSP